MKTTMKILSFALYAVIWTILSFIHAYANHINGIPHNGLAGTGNSRECPKPRENEPINSGVFLPIGSTPPRLLMVERTNYLSVPMNWLKNLLERKETQVNEEFKAMPVNEVFKERKGKVV